MHINEAKDKRIKEILNSAGQLIVPRFQRPYSWTEDKVKEFFDDILLDLNTDYFIGALVLYKINNDKGIIDGQQRLTTIIIALSALRDKFIELENEDLAKGIHINYIEKTDDQNKDYYKLSTETSYPFLQHSILPYNKDPLPIKLKIEEQIIKDASSFIKKLLNTKLEGKNPEQQIVELNKIKERILDLYTVYIELDDEDDAYQIFETLNTRGEDLSLADRIKNHLFKYLTTRNPERDTANTQWKNIMQVINDSKARLNMDDFIYHRWNANHTLTTKTKIFKLFKKEINSKDKAKEEIKSLLSDIKLYRFINDPEYFVSDKLNNRLIIKNFKLLSTLGIKLAHPALLALLKNFNYNEISLKNLLYFLKNMLRFHFIFNTLLSSRSSGITNSYASLAQTISSSNCDKNNIVRDFSLFKQTFKENKAEIKQSFNALIFTNNVSKNKKLVQYVLSNIECYYSNNMKNDTSNLTIEHLLPQSLLNNGYKDVDIGQIGNLILVDDNIQDKLKNKSLREKFEILKQNKISVSHLNLYDISDNIDENLDLIRKRTDDIFEKDFCKIWKID